MGDKGKQEGLGADSWESTVKPLPKVWVFILYEQGVAEELLETQMK